MASNNICITVGAEWRDVEPSGELCWLCDDMCLLREVAFIVIIGSIESDSGFRLCGSCADAAAEERGE